jgi:hypothetical protein
MIEEMTTRELYGITPFRVHEYLINGYLREWKALCLDSFLDVERILRNVIATLRQRHFSRFQSSGLYMEVWYNLSLFRG